MERGSNPLLATVQDHFGRTWDMLVEIIGNIPGAQWTRGEMMTAST